MSIESISRERHQHGQGAGPVGPYYGVNTARARDTFSISGVQLRTYPNLIKALAMVKLAAARANFECGRLTERILIAIEGACREIIAGKLHDQFPLDIYQGEAGSATNVNINEVIANRSLELMGYEKGDYRHCHPEDHVNASQSTQEVYSTALRVAMALGNLRLLTELRALISELRAKAREFRGIVNIARRELPHAESMRLDQDFTAFADTLSAEVRALAAAQRVLCEVRMGTSAIGAGSHASHSYLRRCVPHLAAVSGLLLCRAADPVDARDDTPSFVLYSSCMKSFAIKLSRICNDLRLLSYGPRCGLNAITLPALENGSGASGKATPVVLEVVNMVCFRVIGSDQTVSMAAESEQLQLNVFQPLIAACILEAQTLFISAVETLRVHCVKGLNTNPEVCRRHLEPSIATAPTLTEQQIAQALAPLTSAPPARRPVPQTNLTSRRPSAPPDPSHSEAT